MAPFVRASSGGGSDAAGAGRVVFAPEILARIDALLLAQAALHFQALHLLIGVVAVLLTFQGAVALALLQPAVEIALQLLRLGMGSHGAEGDSKRHGPKRVTK